jgi:hypothetical protein
MRISLAALVFLLSACSPDKPPEQEPPEIGQVMMENGRRFELSGRAATNGRWEFSEYEAHEMQELFEGDLADALLPPDCNDQIAEAMFNSLERTYIPALATAAHRRDRAAYDRAFRDAATTCNGCHSACRVQFVEVPSVPGSAVPNIDPVNPAN